MVLVKFSVAASMKIDLRDAYVLLCHDAEEFFQTLYGTFMSAFTAIISYTCKIVTFVKVFQMIKPVHFSSGL